MQDPEFGEITLRSRRGTSRLSIRVATNGKLVLTHPVLTPKFFIRRFVESSRADIRKLMTHSAPTTVYRDGDSIGKSHTLLAKPTTGNTARISRDGQQVVVLIPESSDITHEPIQRLIRDEAVKILRVEAKRYLPRRLKFIAEKYGHHYERVRFSHASSRWGSCSSAGTISLNIALMKLPFELIDYVLMHELAHTRQMNHSPAFWREVEQMDPQYRLHRRLIKRETPTV